MVPACLVLLATRTENASRRCTLVAYPYGPVSGARLVALAAYHPPAPLPIGLLNANKYHVHCPTDPVRESQEARLGRQVQVSIRSAA